MNRTFGLTTVLAATLLAVAATPSGAQEQEGRRSGPYLSLSGFFLGLTDTEISDITTGSIERDLEADDGWGGGLALGYGSGGGLRLEVEGAYRENDADLQPGGPILAASQAEIHSIAVMGNVYFEPQLHFPINPYIGGGAGWANVALDVDDLDIDDDEWVFAYQAMAGAVLKLGDRAGLFAGYRYFATDDPAFRGTDIEYRTHNLEVGLRFGF